MSCDLEHFFLPKDQRVIFTILMSACFFMKPSICQQIFLCQRGTLPSSAMERIRLSKKKSCCASFISALLISWASDGSLTVLMIGDDKLRTLSRSPIRSVAELDVINLILHFLHPPPTHHHQNPLATSTLCVPRHTRNDTSIDHRTLREV